MCHQPAKPADVVLRPELELADLFRRFAGELPWLTTEQARVVRDITRCRTAELGAHIYECDHCGREEIRFNSCRNRHCPKCQGLEQIRWLEAREAELLPVEYFHVVFTIPDALHPVFMANQALGYQHLFAAVSETLKMVGLNPGHLGARLGFTAVLHTWTQKLTYHPHIHCIVPGGGPSIDDKRWISAKSGFLLPVRALSKVFRGKLLSKLENALRAGKLSLPSGQGVECLELAARKSWVVYSKAPFAGPQQVLRYLGRYTHRIALSNHRIVALEGRCVTFQWRDRADGNKTKLLKLDVVDFLRRFLLHVMPSRFMRIRHYGFLANSVRKKGIDLCRKLLHVDAPPHDSSAERPGAETWQEFLRRLTGVDVTRCSACGVGNMIRTAQIPRMPVPWSTAGRSTCP